MSNLTIGDLKKLLNLLEDKGRMLEHQANNIYTLSPDDKDKAKEEYREYKSIVSKIESAIDRTEIKLTAISEEE